MSSLQILSASEQVADYLRAELLSGRWTDTMPGGDRLVAQLGIGKETVRAALSQLENEGLLIPQGRRKRRLIVLPEKQIHRQLRVRILLYEREDAGARNELQ
jgi:DNA-binding GntR family transcriptional regulator